MKLIKKVKSKSYLLDILYVFFSTRIALFLLALLFMGFADPGRNIKLAEAFSAWDGQWYLRIAKEGYHWNGPDIQANVAFFPLYPLVAKIVSLIFGNLEFSFFVVSHISFFIFLIFLYKIAKEHFGRDICFRAIWYLSIFPLSFVFSIFYSESLFLMLSSGAIYFAYRKKWTVAVLFSIFATLTKLAGLVLLPTLFFCYLRINKKYKLSDLIQMMIIPLGTLLFSVYLHFKVGDLLAFLHVLKAWHILWQNPLITLASTFELIKSIPKDSYFTALSIFDLTTLVSFFILLILSYKRLPKELFLFSLLIFIFNIFKSWDPTFFYPLGSTNRYLFEAFPLFLILAKFGRSKLFELTYTTLSLIFLGILSLSFFSGKWVF